MYNEQITYFENIMNKTSAFLIYQLKNITRATLLLIFHFFKGEETRL